ncbi:MAG: hypothetical protein AB8G23_10020 [Myxococcota bacterium]
MSAGLAYWKGRRKDVLRCRAQDLRVLSPLIGVALCVVSSASFIFAVERLGPDRFETLAQIVQISATTPDAKSESQKRL